jgi:cytochrome c-type biogenesis protein CcmH
MNSRLLLLPPSLLAALILLFAAPRIEAQAKPDPDVSFQEVEESLTCQCGCGLTVHSCNHLQCPSALPLRAEIREQIGLGKDKTAILAHFEEKYGEKILSSPTTEGLNLLAWVTPFLLVALGAVLVAFTARHWSKKKAAAASEPATPSTTASPYSEVLDKELKDFDA